MQSWKRVLVIATLIGTVAAVSACRRELRHEPMKLGGDLTQEQTAQ